MKTVLAFLIALVLGLAGAVAWLVRSSRVRVLKKLRGNNALLKQDNVRLQEVNWSLGTRNEHLRTTLNELKVAFDEHRDKVQRLERANDQLRAIIAQQGTELKHEKKRADDLYQRVIQLLAESNRLEP